MRPARSLPTLAICGALVLITWIVFGRTIGFDFVNYDDSFYVYQNPAVSNGFTRAGLTRAFTQPLVGNWHPLTSISLMLDAQIFGLNPGGYHFANVLLHTLGVLLLFFALRRMTGATWRSAFVAALFAIHPLRAESVVWISERKDVLSGIFFFLALLAYVRYARRPPALGAYLILMACFALGLMAKAMLVTLPFLLLLLDYWPLRRFGAVSETAADEKTYPPVSVRWLILEKMPLLALVVADSIATILSQERALVSAAVWPLRWRVENALVTIWIYLRQMIWPQHLAVFYPHPKGTLSLWLVALALLFFLAASLGAFLARRRYPYLFTGWFWYVGMLVPVIGLIQVGLQAHADRYTYLPQIGVYLLIVWGVAELTRNWPSRRVILGGLGTAVILTLMLVTWRQTGYWSEPVRFWAHTLAVTENNDVAERGIGTALAKIGRIDEATAHDRAALRINPHEPNGLTNLANALLQKKEFAEAIEHYREVVRLRPNDSEVRRNLGKALVKNGATEEGSAQFRAALRIQPNDSDAAYSLGNALLEESRLDEAISSFRQALASDPKNIEAHYNLGIALSRKGEFERAIAEFESTIQLQPQHAAAHNNLALVLLKKGEVKRAIEEERKALRIEPNNVELHNNLAVGLLRDGQLAAAVTEWRETVRLHPDKTGVAVTLAWILSTAPERSIRDGARALDLAQRAAQASGGRNLMIIRVLAAAYAENGRYREAIQAAQEAEQSAEASGQAAIANLLRGDLDLYRLGIPLRDPTHGGGTPSP
ncbi:MAG TPA: tetratricopeptide repeat protein [Chthoniobacterales bacterium]|nr:tetratricopeptide repeat protein [Chthoniobacterales bacterium]